MSIKQKFMLHLIIMICNSELDLVGGHSWSAWYSSSCRKGRIANTNTNTRRYWRFRRWRWSWAGKNAKSFGGFAKLEVCFISVHTNNILYHLDVNIIYAARQESDNVSLIFTYFLFYCSQNSCVIIVTVSQKWS